jgi:hypothetical protein
VINRDTIVALFVLAGTAALYVSLSTMQAEAVIFIRVVVFAIGALALLLLGQSLFLKRRIEGRGTAQSSTVDKKDSSDKKTEFAWKPVSFIFVAVIMYFTVMEKVGFYVSAFMYFVLIVFVLDWKGLTAKTGLIRVGSAFVFILIIYILFNKILLVQTPKGFFL